MLSITFGLNGLYAPRSEAATQLAPKTEVSPKTQAKGFYAAAIGPRKQVPDKIKINWGGKYKTSSFYPGQCVWWVSKVRGGLKFGGNANEFPANAKKAGVATGMKPIKGAIFITDESFYGHAGIVDSVSKDGKTFKTSEMNYVGWNIVSSRTLKTSDAKIFIY